MRGARKWVVPGGGLVHVKRRSGHREAYQRLFCDLLGLEPSTGRAWSNLRAMIAAPYVLFATLDGEEMAFTVIALVRAALGKPTVALFLRPQGCFSGTMKAKLKRALFRSIKLVRPIRILTILPFDIQPNFAAVADDWIYDPQLWDLTVTGEIESVPDTALSRKVTDQAAGRPVLAFLGSVSRLKGIHLLKQSLDLTPGWLGSIQVVIAGRVHVDCAEAVEALSRQGALVENRVISDEELASLYRVSDYVWCCYDPSYDQASGVFGRAVQFGRTPVVRRGSALDFFSRSPGYSQRVEVQTISMPLCIVSDAVLPRDVKTSDVRHLAEESLTRLVDTASISLVRFVDNTKDRGMPQ
jgi:glycosyltransferase involved in cell wall biosynthesis